MGGVGRQNITVKYMGQLSERPFLLACLQKFLRKEAEAEASRLCKFWQEQLMNPEWYPFKTDTVGGISEVHRVPVQTIAYGTSILVGDKLCATLLRV